MINRRTLIAAGAALATNPAFAARKKKPAPFNPAFPPGFLWGAATAGHQIEGNNTNSDFWLLEHTTPTVFTEPSGDACNSWQLWSDDLDLIKTIGLNSYRFSIEWARIEPAAGQFSIAMLDYYQRMVRACRERGIIPVVTFSHWTVPIWFAALGGWLNADAPQLFARFCYRAARHLAADIGYAVTLNEPNGLLIAHKMMPPVALQAQEAMFQAARKATGAPQFIGGPAAAYALQMQPQLLKAHRLAVQAIKAVRSDLPVGFSLAIVDEQASGQNSVRDVIRKEFYGAWLESARQDDFIGIQNYERNIWDAKGLVAPPESARRNANGAEIYPASLANSVRYAYQVCGRPILVTEHGVLTDDDTLRSGLIPEALAALKQAIDDGVPVLGYLHWTLIDNFEWVSGYKAKFGLASVDRTTFARTLKPSASVLGAIARRNAL
jgi:beta-glucosidase